MKLPERARLGDAVAEALTQGRPVVALETAVVTHGLPEPENVQAMAAMSREIELLGGVPAPCMVEGGCLWIGAEADRVAYVARSASRQKASVRDLGIVLASQVPAGLTVSATLFAATLAGIRVFATGGIGGVHRDASETGDVSTDLYQLARSAVVTICSGAKSVLDIPRTLEYLETLGVPVFSYQTEEFPAFYLRSSGLRTPSIDSARAIAGTARGQWDLGYETAIVVANPIPPDEAIAPEDWETWMSAAQEAGRRAGIRGKEVTPFLLQQVAEASGGKTVRANVALLRSNARLAAEIALSLAL
jgi:pseudouridine-5'-phosphate glycosidase